MNEILKEFKIVFGLDNKNLESGLKKSENSLKNFSKTLNSLISTYFSYKMFSSVIKGFADFNTNLSLNLKMLNSSSDYVSALGGALKRYGGDTDSAINSLNSLSNALQSAKLGSGALIEMNRLFGVSFMKSNGALMTESELLKSLSKQFKNFDKQTQNMVGSALGLDKSLILALSDGEEALNKLLNKQKAYGVLTNKDLKISNDFTNALLDLKDSFNAVVRGIARLVLPVFTSFLKKLESFIEFLKRHKSLVIAFFSALNLAMTPILAMVTKLAIGSAAAFSPFLAIGAAIASIALVAEDVYGYFKGWDTITGDLVKKYPALQSALEFIKPLVMGIADTFKSIVDWLKDPSWAAFANIFKTAGEAIVNFLQKPLEYVSSLVSSVTNKLKDFFLDNRLVKFFSSGGLSKNEAPMLGSSVTNNGGDTININNNINNSISSPTPNALVENYSGLINSINKQRVMQGG